ncbi:MULTISPECIES: hypothetical protein [Paenibacillus]|uniref:Uncharacterized protein n=1 Tax=Paenibacillus glycanilyticus TaxID=126569 RepID=A0ABQ6NT50_9BACL|nr:MULTISPECIES: hypothetical protein [Paenibacillus]MCK9861379.1 hypothetical protein [Paenibacillus sp. ATY16]GMK48290.1 hypothetical protein PghCCS26_54200 [Paenibacillus glycanilyticus]
MEQASKPQQDATNIPQEEFFAAAALFCRAYPVFVAEIDRVEAERGRLNDFQLMRAVNKAKEGLVILGWDCRKAVNALFDTYVEIYKHSSKDDANEWAESTFGCSKTLIYEPPLVEEEILEHGVSLELRIEQLTALIHEQEATLLQNYRDLYRLKIAAAHEAEAENSLEELEQNSKQLEE